MSKHILYISARSPFARRVRLVLEEMQIPYNTMVLNVFDPPAWFWQINPSGRVPVLELPTGERIVDSNLIQKYLENSFSDHPLFLAASHVSFAAKANITAAALSVMELVIQNYLESIRPLGKQLPEDFEEYRGNIKRVLNSLELQIKSPIEVLVGKSVASANKNKIVADSLAVNSDGLLSKSDRLAGFSSSTLQSLASSRNDGTGFFGAEIGMWDLDLGAALGYCNLRMGAELVSGFPKLRAYLKGLEKRSSFSKTKPPAV